MNYTQEQLSEMSDFEINCLVAMIVNPELGYADEGLVTELKDESANFRLCNAIGEDLDAGTYNFCKNPADMMPIAIENKIDMFYEYRRKKWDAWYYGFKSGNENLYRAICEVFILMKQEQKS